MREIDKLKKKLKNMIWWNKHRNNFYLMTMCPLAALHLFFTPFFPIVGIVGLSLYLVIGIIAGIDITWNEGKLERKIEDLKGHIDVLQGVNKETLIQVENELEQARMQTTVTPRDKELKKSLIRELIERKKVVETALKESEEINKDSLEDVIGI